MIITYLMIGLVVSLFIMGFRLILGKPQKAWRDNECDEFVKDPRFWVSCIGVILLGMIINATSWPLAIVCEINNTIKGL